MYQSLSYTIVFVIALMIQHRQDIMHVREINLNA